MRILLAALFFFYGMWVHAEEYRGHSSWALPPVPVDRDEAPPVRFGPPAAVDRVIPYCHGDLTLCSGGRWYRDREMGITIEQGGSIYLDLEGDD
jgi:hypothetical protein